MTRFEHFIPSVEALAKEELRPRIVVNTAKLPSQETVAVFAAIGEAVRNAALYQRDEKTERFKAEQEAERQRRKKKTEE